MKVSTIAAGRYADEAALKLKITEMLSDQERRMISVCVIDVSQPAG